MIIKFISQTPDGYCYAFSLRKIVALCLVKRNLASTRVPEWRATTHIHYPNSGTTIYRSASADTKRFALRQAGYDFVKQLEDLGFDTSGVDKNFKPQKAAIITGLGYTYGILSKSAL